MQEAVVSVIDISDPSGKIRLHSHFSTYGTLQDQFKQAVSTAVAAEPDAQQKTHPEAAKPLARKTAPAKKSAKKG